MGCRRVNVPRFTGPFISKAGNLAKLGANRGGGSGPFFDMLPTEAGNMAANPAYADPDYLDDLQLLSTSHQSIARPPLTTFGDTSAAAALAARLAATVWHKYPTLTPETLRALMIHSAEWTSAMLSRFTNARGDVNYKNVVRCFGHGVPNLRRLLSSLDNSLTLIAEGEIQPFFKEDGRVKTREMVLHDLPWPIDELAALQNTDVTMRVTLSYFVAPSPGARGWTSRYGYQSHGLRFAVRHQLETPNQFQERINKFVREEDYESPGLSDQVGNSDEVIPSPRWDRFIRTPGEEARSTWRRVDISRSIRRSDGGINAPIWAIGTRAPDTPSS
jgi:hypothetical protein